MSAQPRPWVRHLVDETCFAAAVMRAPLVLESEWGNAAAVDYDFRKLLIANANLRVMLFADRTKADARNQFDRLEQQARACAPAVTSGRFLLCGWSNEDRALQYREL